MTFDILYQIVIFFTHFTEEFFGILLA